jgi:alpha 1,2-mannosyltransferase
VLHLANHMITNPDMYGVLGYGDKDLFRYSFYALGLPYQQAPKIFATTGGFQTQNGEDSDSFCGHSSEWIVRRVVQCMADLSLFVV